MRIGNAGHKTIRIHGQTYRFGWLTSAAVTAIKAELVFIPPCSHRIKFLEADSDGIDQIVAGGANGVRHVLTHAIPIGLWMSFGGCRKIRVHARWGRGYMLAEELLAHEEASAGD